MKVVEELKKLIGPATEPIWIPTLTSEGLWIAAPDTNAPVICDIVGRKDPGEYIPEDFANAKLIAIAANNFWALVIQTEAVAQSIGAPGNWRRSCEQLVDSIRIEAARTLREV